MTDSGLRVTAEREEPGGVVCLVDVTSEQLHGLSCYLCDNPGALLAAAGHLYTATGDGGRREQGAWAGRSLPAPSTGARHDPRRH
jgi:hypothetical protein